MLPRFYSPASLPRANLPALLVLDEAAAQHVRVRRLVVGDALTLFDGATDAGLGEAHAVLKQVDKRQVLVEITGWQTGSAESPLDVALMQALAVGDKMDLVIQKAVELGACEVIPMRTTRATLKLDGERAEKRVAHWQAVAVSASEQCGRNRVPVVSSLQSFDDVLANPRRKAILHPAGGQSLVDWVQANRGEALAFLVGPEGGFTEEELARARIAGAVLVTFGPRVLRTETAGLAALAAANAIAGDLK